MRVFLSDGTLLMDSCWETYRLSQWHREADGSLRWQEDEAEIAAEILTLSEATLTLRLKLVTGSVDENYTAARVPYVCPDMQR